MLNYNYKRWIGCLIILLIVPAFFKTSVVLPQSNQKYKIKTYTTSIAGKSSHAGQFNLSDVIGQPATIGISKGTTHTLIEGFLAQECGTITLVKGDENPIPATYYLNQNYPNPFNPSTTIEFGIAKAGQVKIRIMNILGQLVAESIDQHYQAGTYKIIVNASNLVSGVYFYQIEAENYKKIKKMVLTK